MSSILQSRLSLIVILILSIPIIFPLYNPSLELGFLGMILGFIGLVISPLLLFGVLFIAIGQAGRKENK